MLLIKSKKKNTNRYSYLFKNYSFIGYIYNVFLIYKKKKYKITKRRTNIHYFNSKKNHIFNLSKNIFLLKNVYLLVSFIFNKNKNNYIGYFKDINGFFFINNLNNSFTLGNFFFNNFFIIYKYLGYSYILLMLNQLSMIFNLYTSYFLSITPGVFATCLNLNFFNKNINILLSSNTTITVSYLKQAIYGRVSNSIFNKIKYSSFKNKIIYKQKGIRVRGCCKNPVDHHNGGNTRGKKKFYSFFNKIAKNSK